jgi:hypothetical protein
MCQTSSGYCFPEMINSTLLNNFDPINVSSFLLLIILFELSNLKSENYENIKSYFIDCTVVVVCGII